VLRPRGGLEPPILSQAPGKGIVASRPRILDAAGKAVRLSHPGNAVLMAAAPALHELLEEVTEQLADAGLP
jgi:hypothetical protein